jgi:hypothetical protein
MGKIIIFLLFVSCNNINYKYKITKEIQTKKGLQNAIWITDTISFKGDTAYYINSDNSVVKIAPPYKIFKLK